MGRNMGFTSPFRQAPSSTLAMEETLGKGMRPPLED